MAKGKDTRDHPNRQVGRSSWSAAMDARTAEYDAVRAGTMSDEDARRVDINPTKVRAKKNSAGGSTLSFGLDAKGFFSSVGGKKHYG